MKILQILILFLLSTNCIFALTITGAGSTFAAPIYSQWSDGYQKKTNITINYLGIGSGEGINQIKAGKVDFGGTDKPLSPSDLKTNNLMQFPTVLGAIVPVVNIPNVKNGELKLTGEILANIFLGKIQKWSDPVITKLNPDLNLPDLAIKVIHRLEGSGSTFLFTDYLSKISLVWSKNVGSDMSVNWPTGVAAKGNEGIALYVKQSPGSISYVEHAYAMVNNMSIVQLKNKENLFVMPTVDAIKSAASRASWENISSLLIDQPGPTTWPITGATYVLIKVPSTDPDKTKAVLDFFDWAFHGGEDIALSLNYVPLPSNVVSIIEKQWTNVKNTKNQPVWMHTIDHPKD